MKYRANQNADHRFLFSCKTWICLNKEAPVYARSTQKSNERWHQQASHRRREACMGRVFSGQCESKEQGRDRGRPYLGPGRGPAQSQPGRCSRRHGSLRASWRAQRNAVLAAVRLASLLPAALPDSYDRRLLSDWSSPPFTHRWLVGSTVTSSKTR